MKVFDFLCECGTKIEDMIVDDGTRFVPCPDCGQPAEKMVSAPMLGKMNDPAARAAALRKRSHDHTMKNLSKEPEKFGFEKDAHRRWNIHNKK